MYFHCSDDFQNNIRRNFTSNYLPSLFYHSYNLTSHNFYTSDCSSQYRQTGKRGFLEEGRKTYLELFTPYDRFFFSKKLYLQFCYNNDYSITAKLI